MSWKALEQEDCAVCLESFRIGEALIPLPCAHRFHYRCLKPWLENNSHCPCCRTTILQSLDWIFFFFYLSVLCVIVDLLGWNEEFWPWPTCIFSMMCVMEKVCCWLAGFLLKVIVTHYVRHSFWHFLYDLMQFIWVLCRSRILFREGVRSIIKIVKPREISTIHKKWVEKMCERMYCRSSFS